MKKILNFLILLAFFTNAIAQEIKNQTQFIIAGVPHYLIHAGVRIDFEKQLRKPAHWLVFAPQVYWYDNPDGYFRNYSKKTGFGINAFHKYYISQNYKKAQGFYMLYGIGFQMYNMESNDYDFDFDQWVVNKFNVYQGELNLCLGHQWLIKDIVTLDIYMGFRGKANNLMSSSNEDDRRIHRIWNDNDFYPVFVSAFKLGVVFPCK